MSASLVTPESAVDCATTSTSTTSTSSSPSPVSSVVSPNSLIRPKLLAFEINNTTTDKKSVHAKSPSVSPSPTSPNAFVAEMPQWKKDLIQRRKTNVARNSILAADTLTSVTTASNANANDDHEHDNDLVEGVALADEDNGQAHVAGVFVFNDNVKIKSTKVQQQRGVEEETSQAETEAEAVSVAESVVAAVSGQQQLWQQKNVRTKMPVTTTTPLQGKHELSIATTLATTAASSNILVKSPTSPSIREKAEKLLHSGGHYTPPPVILDGKRIKRKNEDLIGIFSKADVAADNNISTTSSSLSSSSCSSSSSSCSSSIIVQKQRSLYEKNTKELLTTSTTTTMIAAAGKQAQLKMNKEEIEVQEENKTTNSRSSRNRVPTSLNFDNTNGSGTQLDNNNSSFMVAATTTTKQTIRARSPLLTKQHQQQSHLKRDSEQTQEETRTKSHIKQQQQQNDNNELLALSSNKNSEAKKLFNSLQNNQFVKNQLQQQQQQISPKKYNNKKKQEIITTNTTSVTGSPTKLYASAVVSTTTTIAAAASSDCISVGVSVKNNKMVAVQEMKKTTQNATHSHHHNNNSNNNSTNYDSGEDLSYGPGIVEKLRVRYLSWAQRESMVEHQRRSLETLRRATSLSTLLDREHGEEEQEEEEEAEITAKNVLNQNNYNNQQQQQSQQKQQQLVTPVPAQRQSIKVVGGILKSGHNISEPNSNNKKTATFESNGSSEIIRGSRALKRGNDSLKRARSVEALLSERVAWNFNPSANSSFTSNVTIEDKIINARERLVMGTDVMPPKRLTSIIDETERPPPDLVKQTLKKFEATANRRPRPTRANSKGEVASKVATYKSIINEQKPAILAKPLPTTPNSPTKSPTNRNNKNGSVLSENTPDLIPRQKHLKLKSLELVDSPVTALTKRIEKLRLSTGSVDIKTETTRCATNSAVENHDHVNEGEKEEKEKTVVGAETAQESSALAAVSSEHDIRKIDDEVLNVVAAFCSVVDKQTDDGGDENENENGNDNENENDNDNDDLEETAGIVSPSNSSVFSDDEDSLGLTKRVSRRALDNIARAGTTQQFIFSNTTSNNIESESVINNKSNNNNMRPLLNSAATNQVKQKSVSYAAHLTSREIEKNRINELKKVTESSTAAAGASTSSSMSSLNNVIQQQQQQLKANTTTTTTTTKGQSELDASASGSPLWANMYKRRAAPPVAVTENTTMVFNFSNRKEVPDYIDNDIVLMRRKRELPKPNESGFVRIGDPSYETSTDSDNDDYSMCPPSPCDVEFENANIVIDGKSSMRCKSKDASTRVQFNDTLTSTFEYPSEASLIVDDEVFHSPYSNTDSSSLMRNYENLTLEETDSPAHKRHHHVAVDEIIPIPTTSANYMLPQINANNTTTTTTTTTTTNTPTKNVMGNLPLDYLNLTKGITLIEQEQEKMMTMMMLEKPKRPRDLPIPAMKSLKPLPNTAEMAKEERTTLEENLTLIVDDDPVLQTSTMREILPLLPRIYKPPILHNYQLKTVKPIFQLKQKDDNNKCQTTTTTTTVMEEINNNNNNNENKQEFKQINDNLTKTTTMTTTITASYDNDNDRQKKHIVKNIDKNPPTQPLSQRSIEKSQVVYNGSHNKSIIHSNGTQKENKQLEKSNENLVSYQQLATANRKIAKVLNKPQYACFLQNSNSNTTTTATTMKRCQSFNYKQINVKKQHNDNNNNLVLKRIALFDAVHNSEQDTITTTMRNQTIRHSFNCLSQRKQEQPLNNSSTSSSTLTSALSLSSTSEALLRTRIPGNIIYYV